MFRRRQEKTHSQLMRYELAEGLGHLQLAAAHAAGGVGAAVGPRWDAARGHLPVRAGTVRSAATNGWDAMLAALAPLAIAARDRVAAAAIKKTKQKESGMARKRTTIMVSLLTAGAAAGAAGAMIARRRSRARWERYEAQGMRNNRSTAGTGTTVTTGQQTPNIFAEQSMAGGTSTTGATTDTRS